MESTYETTTTTTITINSTNPIEEIKINVEEETTNKKSKYNALETRMKEFERNYPTTIPAKSPFLVRLDGHSFSKFTRNLDYSKSPFDDAFTNAMVLAMNDLIDEFHAATGYAHSDEITLIFPPAYETEEENTKTHIYGGRTQKIVSLMASFCSVRFNYHLIQETQKKKEAYSQQTLERINGMHAYFDGRVMIFPEKGEFINHMIWRSVLDCNRNATSSYARFHFGHKKTDGKKASDLRKMLLTEKGIEWTKDVPLWIRHGVYAKKAVKEIQAFDKKEQKEVTVKRGVIENRSFKIHFDEELYLPTLLGKYWPESLKEYEVYSL